MLCEYAFQLLCGIASDVVWSVLQMFCDLSSEVLWCVLLMFCGMYVLLLMFYGTVCVPDAPGILWPVFMMLLVFFGLCS
jgi:hypothetical protein